MRSIYLHTVVLLAIFLGGCSTEKDKWLNRTYHNTTTRYNVFFNGRESFREGVTQLEGAHKEDYSKILPLYIYGDKAAAQSIYPQMDRAVEKASKGINRHSMYIKRKEKNKWIDDCYLLIGQARFYKKDYKGARETFEYVSKAWKKSPSRFTAQLWDAKTYIEEENYSKAGKMLDELGRDGEFPNELKQEYSKTYAYYYVKQKNYPLAFPELKTTISLTKNKRERGRLIFILAQLYQHENDNEKASKYYNQVLSLNPPYEMAFYVKINQAMAYDSRSGNSELIRKELAKMAKDIKNVDFYDQIYYALAELDLKEGKIDDAKDHLKMSAYLSTINDKQKAKSYHKLAILYFDEPQYRLAQAYYDSTVQFLPSTDEDYILILAKRNSLTRLVRNLLIIEKEDSLQNLASMSDNDRNKAIDDMIKRVLEEEERKKEQAEIDRLARMDIQRNQRQRQNAGGSGSNWYFYNPSTMSFGISEFEKMWGKRKLEDNWRRKNKSSMTFSDLDELEPFEELGVSDTSATIGDLKNRDYYKKNIPLTKEKMNLSHNKLIEAYYDLGLTYRERMKDDFAAIETFEKLVSLYDTCRYVSASYYQLYKIYFEMGNTPKADYYKNLILKEFPNSDYAKILRDPNYFAKQEKSKTLVDDYYKDTYELYERRDYQSALQNCKHADTAFISHPLLPKFDLLGALCSGKIYGREIFISELTRVRDRHKGTDVSKRAQELLKYLMDQKTSSNNQSNDQETMSGLYSNDEGAMHNCVIILPIDLFDINSVKADLSNFNNKFFKPSRLKVNTVMMGADKHMVTVKEFKGKDKAMDYYQTLLTSKELGNVNNGDHPLFAITFENLAKFYSAQDSEGYETFFQKHYLAE